MTSLFRTRHGSLPQKRLRGPSEVIYHNHNYVIVAKPRPQRRWRKSITFHSKYASPLNFYPFNIHGSVCDEKGQICIDQGSWSPWRQSLGYLTVPRNWKQTRITLHSKVRLTSTWSFSSMVIRRWSFRWAFHGCWCWIVMGSDCFKRTMYCFMRTSFVHV